ncbi:crossover junction endodeoxyribonuclease RuvC [Mycobacterium sp.]|uniref:crossover junction endodeoxyribonuclease RuvC n=1 Tax=Mycobacterium sp. TaxID=1785 RepID=UPI0025E2FA02|nr:crossover junction endodeoxyribonuclease RuvC [Mycobacterium sp.]
MSVVVGIDPSLTSTGIAVLINGAPLALKTVNDGQKDSKSYAHRSDRIVRQCCSVIDALPVDRIDLAVIEGQAFGYHNAYTSDGNALWWGIFSALRQQQIPTAVVTPLTRQTWVIGREGSKDSTDKKKQVLLAVRLWWPALAKAIRNDDIADAAALASIGAAHCGDQLPFQLKDRHRNTLESIDWPKVTV